MGTTTRDAAYAMSAWNTGRRNRRVSAAVERTADSVIAFGALILINATMKLGFGMPTGRIGLSLGASMLAAGLAWISRHRARRAIPQRVALRTPQPVYATWELRQAA